MAEPEGCMRKHSIVCDHCDDKKKETGKWSPYNDVTRKPVHSSPI